MTRNSTNRNGCPFPRAVSKLLDNQGVVSLWLHLHRSLICLLSGLGLFRTPFAIRLSSQPLVDFLSRALYNFNEPAGSLWIHAIVSLIVEFPVFLFSYTVLQVPHAAAQLLILAVEGITIQAFTSWRRRINAQASGRSAGKLKHM